MYEKRCWVTMLTQYKYNGDCAYANESPVLIGDLYVVIPRVFVIYFTQNLKIS